MCDKLYISHLYDLDDIIDDEDEEDDDDCIVSDLKYDDNGNIIA